MSMMILSGAHPTTRILSYLGAVGTKMSCPQSLDENYLVLNLHTHMPYSFSDCKKNTSRCRKKSNVDKEMVDTDMYRAYLD